VEAALGKKEMIRSPLSGQRLLKEKIVLKDRFRRCAESTVHRPSKERDFDLLTSDLIPLTSV